MIVRIVKMTFKEGFSDTFKEFSLSIHEKIRSFEGCTYLDIYRDVHHPEIFFSYSYWESEEHLNRYRNSEFFKATWAKTKQWFSAKAEAWSVTSIKQASGTNS